MANFQALRREEESCAPISGRGWSLEYFCDTCGAAGVRSGERERIAAFASTNWQDNLNSILPERIVNGYDLYNIITPYSIGTLGGVYDIMRITFTVPKLKNLTNYELDYFCNSISFIFGTFDNYDNTMAIPVLTDVGRRRNSEEAFKYNVGNFRLERKKALIKDAMTKIKNCYLNLYEGFNNLLNLYQSLYENDWILDKMDFYVPLDMVDDTAEELLKTMSTSSPYHLKGVLKSSVISPEFTVRDLMFDYYKGIGKINDKYESYTDFLVANDKGNLEDLYVNQIIYLSDSLGLIKAVMTHHIEPLIGRIGVNVGGELSMNTKSSYLGYFRKDNPPPVLPESAIWTRRDARISLKMALSAFELIKPKLDESAIKIAEKIVKKLENILKLGDAE